MLLAFLLDPLASPLLVGLALGGVALPLTLVGLRLRGDGRRARLRWELLAAARRPLRDVGRGRAVTVGRLRHVGGTVGDRWTVVEDGGARVLVERAPGAPSLAEGAEVLVAGYALATAPDPVGGDYRTSSGAVWVISGGGSGDEALVTGDVHLPERALAAGRRQRLFGSALVALSVALAVAVGALCFRAAYDDADLGTASAPLPALLG